MRSKKKFLLRMDGSLFEAIEKWSADDLRSVNAQIEFLLTQAVKGAGRKVREETSAGREQGAEKDAGAPPEEV
jgi:hypothetical protein